MERLCRASIFKRKTVRRWSIVTMGIQRQFADTRKAQQGDGCIQITVPSDVVEELGIKGGDDVLWTGKEGEDTAVIHSPHRN